MIDLQPLGDRAFLARFETEWQAQRWAGAVVRRQINGVIDVAVAYATVGVFLDPDQIDPNTFERLAMTINGPGAGHDSGRLIRVPVLYDGDDLTEVAAEVGLSTGEVIDRHRSVDYEVFALGFLPGFPYAGYLPTPLAGLPRRSTPRSKVPAGSVAIAGRQTGIYPIESPGGWRLLGRTPLQIVDLAHGFFPIRPGDRLRFESIDADNFRARLGDSISLAGGVRSG